MGDAGFGDFLEALHGTFDSLGLEAKLLGRLQQAQHIGTLLVGGGILPDFGDGDFEVVMCRYRGQTCCTAVCDVMLANFCGGFHQDISMDRSSSMMYPIVTYRIIHIIFFRTVFFLAVASFIFFKVICNFYISRNFNLSEMDTMIRDYLILSCFKNVLKTYFMRII